MSALITLQCDKTYCTKTMTLMGLFKSLSDAVAGKGWAIEYPNGMPKLICSDCARGMNARNGELRDAAHSVKRFLMEFNDDGRMLSPCTIRGRGHDDCVYHIHMEDEDYPYVMVEQFGYSLRFIMILPDGVKIQHDDSFWE